MYHIIYKVTSPSGKFYIGRHSTLDLNDGYVGSGTWVRGIKDKSLLIKEILEYCDDFDTLKEREQFYISENINKDLCMNFNNNPIGFASGELNPSASPERRKQISEFVSGDNNPTKRPEVALAISLSLKGKPGTRKGIPNSEKARQNISKGRTGIKYSDEGRKKLSQVRKRDYDNGIRGVPSFKGLTHDDETLMKMSESAKAREKKECEHCGKICAINVFKRWHGEKCKMKHEDSE